MEERLLKQLAIAEEANEEFGTPRSTRQLIDLQRQAERIINKKDVKRGKELLENVNNFFFALTWREQTKFLLSRWQEDFDEIDWDDRFEARKLLRKASELHAQNAEFGEMRQIMISILDSMPEDEQRKIDTSLLRG